MVTSHAQDHFNQVKVQKVEGKENSDAALWVEPPEEAKKRGKHCQQVAKLLEENLNA